MAEFFSNLIYYFQPYFTFPDVIGNVFEVALVASAVYGLLILIRQTRAEQLLTGIALLLIISWVSDLLGLQTVFFLIKSLTPYTITLLVVVFQPELRRALGRLGQESRFWEKSFFIREHTDDGTAHVEHILEAVQEMSATKTGALIVIEQQTGLQDIITTGVAIDAELSSSLLLNIFVPDTPLHDGATILRGGRIVASGCYLPLTDNPDVNKQLGSRHRSAIGISENSDAVVVVVSEESGVISVARNGKLTRYLDRDSLRAVLTPLYVQDREKDFHVFSFGSHKKD